MTEKNEKHFNNFHELSGPAGMKKIAALVKGIRIAMMSTLDTSGQIRSRPMATQETDFDGTLWFLTRNTSEKVDDLQHYEVVTLDYADPDHSKYITLRGKATLSQDRGKIKELWNAMYKAWFPHGEDDPEITVLRVDITEGEYWEANSSKIIMGIKYVAAAMTGGAVSVGETGHVKVA